MKIPSHHLLWQDVALFEAYPDNQDNMMRLFVRMSMTEEQKIKQEYDWLKKQMGLISLKKGLAISVKKKYRHLGIITLVCFFFILLWSIFFFVYFISFRRTAHSLKTYGYVLELQDLLQCGLLRQAKNIPILHQRNFSTTVPHLYVGTHAAPWVTGPSHEQIF